ncbi:hypothetical protein IIA79_04000, partial [bacterium]|nr:hypothetical protein [bacterium]
MRLTALFFVFLLLLAGRAAWGLGEAVVRPLDWPNDTTFEFAIFDENNKRFATAYYRILKEVSNGIPAYRFKYVGRNEDMSEATECWVNPITMLPMRSTRKVVAGGRTFYQDVAYADGVIVIRRKYEGGEVMQVELPAGPDFFDYEELIWLIPQLSFGAETQIRLSIFETLTELPTTVIVTALGTQRIEISGDYYETECFSFNLNATPYSFYIVWQEGRAVPGRIDMGARSFINM